MPVKKLNPYLMFDGNAEAAIAFYEQALGAKLVGPVMRMGEIPGGNVPPEARQRVMHAELTIDGCTFMVSDAMPGNALKAGSNLQVVLQIDDASEVDRRFDAVAAGGTVEMAPHDAFWGDRFAMLTDRFGIRWMLIGPRRA